MPLPAVRRFPAGWIALALLGSAALGIGMQATPMLVVDVVLAAVVAVAVALRPFESLLLILALRATVVNSVFADVATFADWADALSIIFGFLSPEQADAATAALAKLNDYVDDLLEQRRAAPGDDLVSALVVAEVDGVPVMECRCGVLNGQYALRVERMLPSASQEAA